MPLLRSFFFLKFLFIFINLFAKKRVTQVSITIISCVMVPQRRLWFVKVKLTVPFLYVKFRFFFFFFSFPISFLKYLRPSKHFPLSCLCNVLQSFSYTTQSMLFEEHIFPIISTVYFLCKGFTKVSSIETFSSLSLNCNLHHQRGYCWMTFFL